MGTFAEDCARELPVHARGAGRLCASTSLEARANARSPTAPSPGEIAPVSVKAGKARDAGRDRRAAAQGEARQDPDAQARLPRRRHGDRGQFQLDLRRRRGARADAPLARPRSAALTPLARDRRPCHPRAGAPNDFPTAPIGAMNKLFEQTGWSQRGRRSLRDQRGLRRRRHGGDARSRPAARQGQRAWRRLRARPSDRRVGRAHHRDAARGA